MSNFIPKLVKSDKEQSRPKTINELYDAVLQSVQDITIADEAEEFEDFVRHISHVAVLMQGEVGQLEDSPSARYLRSQILELMMIVAGNVCEVPNFRSLREEHSDRSAALYQGIQIIRQAHSELWSTAKDKSDLLEKITPLVTPRELLSAEQRHEIWCKNAGHCVYCDTELAEPDIGQESPLEGSVFHVDHLVAKSSYGPDHMANYVPSCEPCNIRKGAKDPVKFINGLCKRRKDNNDDSC